MREHKGKSGIYKIRNKLNDKLYIGKTKCFYKRFCQYVSDVRNNTKGRINDYLMNSFIKYGFDNFEFDVVEFCNIEECAEREVYWIQYFDTLNKEVGYNFRLDSSTGMITHPDTIAKMSSNLKLQWYQGLRDGHSDKLKASWAYRSREDQSLLMTKNLTKYKYVVNFPDGTEKIYTYRELKENGFSSALSTMYKNSLDKVIFKKIYIVERFKINEQRTR